MEIRIQDYIKDNERGVSAAASRAIDDLKSGDTLLLGGETLHFYPDGTREKYDCISNNDRGDKKIVFPLTGKDHLTIDGEGAELIFHGEILPFTVNECTDITLKNLKIDYASPMYIQAEIESVGKECMVLQFDEKDFKYYEKDGELWMYHEEDGWKKKLFPCLVTEFDQKTNAPSPEVEFYIAENAKDSDHGFMSSIFKGIHYKDLGNGRLEVSHESVSLHKAGNLFVGTFDNNRHNPGIFINHSKNVHLENISLYHTLSMGVICQLSENISLSQVCAKPREGSGRVLSVCADSTHFVNCRGKITLKDCMFVNMLDDAVNIHGIYHKLLKADDRCLICEIGHFQQAGIFSYENGDEIALVNAENGKAEAVYRVKNKSVIDEETVCLEVEEPLEIPNGNFVIENLTANPEIEISGCECGNNRPRGFLLSSPKKTVVENCIFYNMYAGIYIEAGIGGWYESGCVKDVTIRKNEFRNCAYVSGPAIQIVPVFGEAKNLRGLHFNITIQDNVFMQPEKRFLHAHAVDGLCFKNNRYINIPSIRRQGILGEEGVLITHCDNVIFEPVEEIEKIGE